jgi:hypothetical protein
MLLHGINNVRGGTYCQLELSRDIEYLLQQELNHAKDKCFKCGSTTHYANNCLNKKRLSKSLSPKKSKIDINEYAIYCLCFGDDSSKCSFHAKI